MTEMKNLTKKEIREIVSSTSSRFLNSLEYDST